MGKRITSTTEKIMSRKSTDYFIIHCTATKPSMDIGYEEINRWHRERGFLSCGYHFIIKRNGVIEDGRTTDAVGAHCRGKNHNSIGIAMVGGVTQEDHTKAEDNFLPEQWESLKKLIEELHTQYPEAQVKGHYHFSDKFCPSFDVDEWAKTELLWVEGDYLPGDERDE